VRGHLMVTRVPTGQVTNEETLAEEDRRRGRISSLYLRRIGKARLCAFSEVPSALGDFRITTKPTLGVDGI
jgi:hypothetical protein